MVRTSSRSLATMSSGVSTGTYSLAASWYIITRRWLSSCACCARATIVAIVALACRSASKECSRTASMSFQTLRSSGLSKCSAAPRCASSWPSMMPSCSSACLALISCALCVFLSSCCSLAATWLGVKVLASCRVLLGVRVLQPRRDLRLGVGLGLGSRVRAKVRARVGWGDLAVLLGLDAELEVGQVVAHDEHGDRDVRLLG